MKYITVVGRRNTPIDYCNLTTSFCLALLNNNPDIIFRSGDAKQGMDLAVRQAVDYFDENRIESFIPYNGFNNKFHDGQTIFSLDKMDSSLVTEAENIVKSIIDPSHWDNCNPFTRRAHTRNVFQVLGKDLKTPSTFVYLYSPWVTLGSKVEGGTNVAFQVASKFNIRIDNLYDDHIKQKTLDYVEGE